MIWPPDPPPAAPQSVDPAPLPTVPSTSISPSIVIVPDPASTLRPAPPVPPVYAVSPAPPPPPDPILRSLSALALYTFPATPYVLDPCSDPVPAAPPKDPPPPAAHTLVSPLRPPPPPPSFAAVDAAPAVALLFPLSPWVAPPPVVVLPAPPPPPLPFPSTFPPLWTVNDPWVPRVKLT